MDKWFKTFLVASIVLLYLLGLFNLLIRNSLEQRIIKLEQKL